MRLISAERLRSFLGDPRLEPGKKMSGRKLARIVGCNPSYIQHLLAGRSRTAKPVTAQRIAEALDVPLDILFMPSIPRTARQGASQDAA